MLATMDDLTSRRIDLPLLQERVRQRRERLRLDQETLADKSGMSAAYISRLERGAIPNPKVFDLERVAAGLDMSLADLVRQPSGTRTETYALECAEITEQLATEPPEVAETVLQWFRDSVRIAKLGRLGRNN